MPDLKTTLKIDLNTWFEKYYNFVSSALPDETKDELKSICDLFKLIPPRTWKTHTLVTVENNRYLVQNNCMPLNEKSMLKLRIHAKNNPTSDLIWTATDAFDPDNLIIRATMPTTTATIDFETD